MVPGNGTSREGRMHALLTIAAASGEPAKGAPIGDVIWGTAAATAATALVIWVAMAHRAGRISWLQRVADLSGRVSGLPPWTPLPGAITGASLIAPGSAVHGGR